MNDGSDFLVRAFACTMYLTSLEKAHTALLITRLLNFHEDFYGAKLKVCLLKTKMGKLNMRWDLLHLIGRPPETSSDLNFVVSKGTSKREDLKQLKQQSVETRHANKEIATRMD